MVFGGTKLLAAMGDTLTIGTVELGKILENTQLTFPIQLPDGITSESGETEAQVDVTLPELVTKTLSITEITLTNQPAGMSAQVITKVLEITVRGPGNLINSITEKHIRVSADMKDVQEGTQTLPVIITTDEEYAAVGVVGTYTVSAVLRKR